MTDRPNIVLITTDQQRFDTVAALGNRTIFTPHLDWLCRQGVAFSRAYADAPLCVAARATIMTGLHGYTTGLTTNAAKPVPMADHPTIPGLLGEAGYQTRAEGKMHFHPPRGHYGFQHMEILQDYYRHMARHPEYGRPLDHGVGQNEMTPVFSTVNESHSLTRWTVDRSIEFMETRDDTRPFFLWTSFAKPHPPYDCNRNYWELYDGIPMPEPKYGDWSTMADDVPPGLRTSTMALSNVHTFTPEQLAASRRAYYACISQIDYNLGYMFARMRELGLYENTWIIFTSDHGEMLGDHWLGAKSIPLEGSAHVPMIIRPPAAAWHEHELQNTRCDELVCLADVLPTCAAIAGLEAAALGSVDGLNMLDAAAGEASRGCIHMMSGGHCGIVEGSHKYVYEQAGNAELLFNLADDPYEQRELIRTGAARDVHERMRNQMIAFLSEHQPDAVRGGQLVGRAAPDLSKSTGMGSWPGLHTRHEQGDVLH